MSPFLVSLINRGTIINQDRIKFIYDSNYNPLKTSGEQMSSLIDIKNGWDKSLFYEDEKLYKTDLYTMDIVNNFNQKWWVKRIYNPNTFKKNIYISNRHSLIIMNTLTIDNCTLSIAPGGCLFVKKNLGGEIIFKNGGKIIDNSLDIGKFYYGTIHLYDNYTLKKNLIITGNVKDDFISTTNLSGKGVKNNGGTLIIPENKTLTIPENKTLTLLKGGEIYLIGTIKLEKNAKIIGYGNIYKTNNANIDGKNVASTIQFKSISENMYKYMINSDCEWPLFGWDKLSGKNLLPLIDDNKMIGPSSTAYNLNILDMYYNSQNQQNKIAELEKYKTDNKTESEKQDKKIEALEKYKTDNKTESEKQYKKIAALEQYKTDNKTQSEKINTKINEIDEFMKTSARIENLLSITGFSNQLHNAKIQSLTKTIQTMQKLLDSKSEKPEPKKRENEIQNLLGDIQDKMEDLD